MSSTDQPKFRLAIRHEGAFVNAYYAQMSTMDGAVLIGSIRHNVCQADEATFTMFKALMTDAMRTAVEKSLGLKVVTTHEQDAPEHEKAGHA